MPQKKKRAEQDGGERGPCQIYSEHSREYCLWARQVLFPIGKENKCEVFID